MADFRVNIPGWLDAVNEERELHDDAFALPHDEIAGVPVRHASLVDITRLARMGNAIASGRFPSFVEFAALPDVQRDAYDFLAYMHVRPSRSPMVNMYRRFRYGRIPKDRLWTGIVEYLNRTYIDELGVAEDRKPNLINRWSSLVDYVDLIAKDYGWTADYVLNMPYRQAIQCARRIIARNDPKCPITSQSDRVLARYLQSKNAR